MHTHRTVEYSRFQGKLRYLPPVVKITQKTIETPFREGEERQIILTTLTMVGRQVVGSLEHGDKAGAVSERIGHRGETLRPLSEGARSDRPHVVVHHKLSPGLHVPHTSGRVG